MYTPLMEFWYGIDVSIYIYVKSLKVRLCSKCSALRVALSFNWFQILPVPRMSTLHWRFKSDSSVAIRFCLSVGGLIDLCFFGFVGFLFFLMSGKGCGLWLWHSLDFSLTFLFIHVCDACVWTLLFPHLSFGWCLGKALLRDYGISWISLLMFFICNKRWALSAYAIF